MQANSQSPDHVSKKLCQTAAGERAMNDKTTTFAARISQNQLTLEPLEPLVAQSEELFAD